jgi:capsular exopolysaccharide synthesis family protein
MSRVHDALKKAEEEKALRGDSYSYGETEPFGAADFHGLGGTRAAAAARSSAKAPSRPWQHESGPEAFLERCSRQDWETDPALIRRVDTLRHALVSEEFRSLRSRLYLLRKVRPVQKLVVTSPLPQEGKTLVAANLARVFAKQAGSRVLLIDANLRSSGLPAVLGAPAVPGLSDYLAGGFEPTSVIQRGPTENLFFIPGGATVPNPSELIGNGRFELLLDSVAPVYDWIIIDSPPAIPVSDARLLAGFCDGVLMLVNAGTTPFELAQKACAEFSQTQLVGVILNRVEPGQNYNSYYHHRKGTHDKGNGKGTSA